MIADDWRAARSSAPPGHLDAAGYNIPSDRVHHAVVDHLRREREVGGHRAAPDLHPSRSALAALVGASAATSPSWRAGRRRWPRCWADGGFRRAAGSASAARSTGARSCCCTAWRG
ncbi:hypothetical protein ACFQX6_40390 [Streptosporangium lutulentum]